MGKHRNKRLLIAAAIGALALTPTAVAGNSGQACPQTSASSCEPVGARPSKAPKSNQQRARPLPRFAFDSNGQQVWRAGNHLMQ